MSLFTTRIDRRSFAELSKELKEIETQAMDLLRSQNNGSSSVTSSLLLNTERNNRAELCRVEYIAGQSPSVAEWAAQNVQPIVEAVSGQKMHLFKDKINLKLPGGGAFGCHQDFAAYRHFKNTRYMTAMIALDDATIENGCVEFAEDYTQVTRKLVPTSADPEQHLFEIIETGPNFGTIPVDVEQLFDWRPIPMTRGDMVIFDGFIPHRSGPNNTNTPRRALFFTYNPAHIGNLYDEYYLRKRQSPGDPIFHVSTPTHRDGNRKTSDH